MSDITKLQQEISELRMELGAGIARISTLEAELETLTSSHVNTDKLEPNAVTVTSYAGDFVTRENLTDADIVRLVSHGAKGGGCNSWIHWGR